MGKKGMRHGVKACEEVREMSLTERRETFLAHFAANCNVKGAAAAAEIPLSTLYLWRRSEPGFVAEWVEAQAVGYQMLEARLVGHALAGDTGDTIDGVADTPVEPLNVELGLKLLQLHGNGRRDHVRTGRPVAKPVTREAMVAELTHRLDVIEARRRREAARAAGDPPAALVAGDPSAALVAGETPAALIAGETPAGQLIENCERSEAA